MSNAFHGRVIRYQYTFFCVKRFLNNGAPSSLNPISSESRSSFAIRFVAIPMAWDFRLDQGNIYGRRGIPFFNAGSEPLARVTLYLTDNKALR